MVQLLKEEIDWTNTNFDFLPNKEFKSMLRSVAKQGLSETIIKMLVISSTTSLR
jgi:hypothetical protein